MQANVVFASSCLPLSHSQDALTSVGCMMSASASGWAADSRLPALIALSAQVIASAYLPCLPAKTERLA